MYIFFFYYMYLFCIYIDAPLRCRLGAPGVFYPLGGPLPPSLGAFPLWVVMTSGRLWGPQALGGPQGAPGVPGAAVVPWWAQATQSLDWWEKLAGEEKAPKTLNPKP